MTIKNYVGKLFGCCGILFPFSGGAHIVEPKLMKNTVSYILMRALTCLSSHDACRFDLLVIDVVVPFGALPALNYALIHNATRQSGKSLGGQEQ
jgi:hypothetical protein